MGVWGVVEAFGGPCGGSDWGWRGCDLGPGRGSDWVWRVPTGLVGVRLGARSRRRARGQIGVKSGPSRNSVLPQRLSCGSVGALAESRVVEIWAEHSKAQSRLRRRGRWLHGRYVGDRFDRLIDKEARCRLHHCWLLFAQVDAVVVEPPLVVVSV